jgi:hypothetical protein
MTFPNAVMQSRFGRVKDVASPKLLSRENERGTQQCSARHATGMQIDRFCLKSAITD